MIILCGKTASGKTTIREKLIENGYKPIVTYTTRPPRPGEVDGIDYYFISLEEFARKKEDGFFAEYTSYKTEEGIWFYGTSAESLENADDNTVIIVNPDGLKKIRSAKNRYNNSVFYIISDEEILWNRLRQRGDVAEEARRRINADEIDFAGIDKYIDFAIRNDEKNTVDEIVKTIMYLYKKTCK